MAQSNKHTMSNLPSQTSPSYLNSTPGAGRAKSTGRGRGYPQDSRQFMPGPPPVSYQYSPQYYSVYPNYGSEVVFQQYPPVSMRPSQFQQPPLASNPPMVSPQQNTFATTSTPVSPGKSWKVEAAPFVPRQTLQTPSSKALPIINPATNTPIDLSAPSSSHGSVNQSSSGDAEKQKHEEKQKERQLKEQREKEEQEKLEKEKEAKQREEKQLKERREKEEQDEREREEREKAEKEREEREKAEKERHEKEKKEEEKQRIEKEKEREACEVREREEKQQKEEAEGVQDDDQDSIDVDSSQNSEQDSSKDSSESQLANSTGKKMYTREFLLSFQDQCRDRPESLPMVEAIVGIEDRQGGNGVLGAGPRNPNMQRRGGSGQRNQGYSSRGGKSTPNSRGPAPKRPPLGGLNPDDPLQKLKRNVTSLLNKITVEKFEEISNKILNVGIDSAQILDEVIGLSFQKAITEPHFANLYADLCVKLSQKCPGFDDPDNPTKKITFKRILLNRCQDEFEKKRINEAAKEIEECKTEEEKEELRFKQRRRMIGNIKFIGELYNRHLLPPSVVANSVIPKLLHPNSDPEELECLCKFMKTSGKVLEASCLTSKGAGNPLAKLNEYFEMIKSFSQDTKYDSRIRFMLLDTLELRQSNWVPRREEKTAKKLKEIHQEHEDEETSNAALPITQPVGHANNFRRTNDRSRNTGSPSTGNNYDKSRENSSRTPVPAKQAPQPIQSAFKDQQTPNLRPNSGGAVWGKAGADQKQNSNPTVNSQRPSSAKPASVTFDLPSTPSEPISLEEWEDLVSPVFEELFVSYEIAETAMDFKQQLSKKKQSSRELQSHLVYTGCLRALDSGADASSHLVKLFIEMIQTDVINKTDLEEGLKKTREQLDELKLDIPHAPFDFCQIISSLFSSEILDFTFFQKLYPLEDSGLDAREAFVQMLLALNKKDAGSIRRLFESKLPITNYFPTAEELLSRLDKMKAFAIFEKIPWEKTYLKDVQSGSILTWFGENKIEFESSDSVTKFMKIFLSRVTRDSGTSQKSAWKQVVDTTKKTELDVIDANSKLLSNLFPTTSLQLDALDAIQSFDKALLERILPAFYEKKIFGVESLTTWIETRGESLDAKLKQNLNSLKGEILSKAS